MTEERKFSNLAEEAEFWDQEDTAPYVEQLEEVAEPLVDKRPPKKAISIRLDPDTILLAKRVARRMGLGYQTLFRLWIMEGLSRALREPSTRPKQVVVAMDSSPLDTPNQENVQQNPTAEAFWSHHFAESYASASIKEKETQ